MEQPYTGRRCCLPELSILDRHQWPLHGLLHRLSLLLRVTAMGNWSWVWCSDTISGMPEASSVRMNLWCPCSANGIKRLGPSTSVPKMVHQHFQTHFWYRLLRRKDPLELITAHWWCTWLPKSPNGEVQPDSGGSGFPSYLYRAPILWPKDQTVIFSVWSLFRKYILKVVANTDNAFSKTSNQVENFVERFCHLWCHWEHSWFKGGSQVLMPAAVWEESMPPFSDDFKALVEQSNWRCDRQRKKIQHQVGSEHRLNCCNLTRNIDAWGIASDGVQSTPLQILEHRCDGNKGFRMLHSQLVRQEWSLRV